MLSDNINLYVLYCQNKLLLQTHLLYWWLSFYYDFPGEDTDITVCKTKAIRV